MCIGVSETRQVNYDLYVPENWFPVNDVSKIRYDYLFDRTRK